MNALDDAWLESGLAAPADSPIYDTVCAATGYDPVGVS